ncbi:MAG: hypothetical protein HY466_00350 [Deltaproteobacteria bacterium]|nr:hypothetical protein [Deltaproteobacteria bacterium]
MKRSLYISALLAGLLAACQPANFSQWRQETFDSTPITTSQSKTISLQNENGEAVQKLSGVGFDGTGDGHEHFRIEKVLVGQRLVGQKDIIVPPGSTLNIQLTYEPRNLETTRADFGGWVTGEPEKFVPYNPDDPPPPPDNDRAIHRVVLLAAYEEPKSGLTMVELVGEAVPGPNGEVSLPEAGISACEAEAGTACFEGNFSMDIPALFTTGPVEDQLAGPIRFAIQGGAASLRMDDVPPILIILKGNGPGEPLEGQPVSAVSIIIKGVQGVAAEGSFDGSRLELAGLSFRILVVVGEISQEDISGLNPIVDFTLEDLVLTTEEPFVDGQITLKIDTTLSQAPSGNPIFDEFLGEKQIIVRFQGQLNL